MKNQYFLNCLLAGMLGIVLLAMIAVRAFFPVMILPKCNVPNLVLISLITLVLEWYLAPGSRRNYPVLALLAAATFALLPWAAGFAAPVNTLKLALAGGMGFTAVTWLFDSMTDRIGSGPAAKAAPLVSAVGLYLASQVLMGLIL